MTGNKCNERFVLLSTASANEGTWNWSRCDVQMGNAIDQCQLLATTEKTVCCLRGFHTHTHACRHSDQAIASLPLHGIRSMPITPKIILFHCTLHTSKVYIYIWRWSIAFRFLGWWESDKHEKKMHTTPKNPGGTMMKATCMKVEGCVLCTRGSLLRQRPTVNSVCVCCVHYMQGRPSIQRHFAEPAGWSLCVCVCVFARAQTHTMVVWWWSSTADGHKRSRWISTIVDEYKEILCNETHSHNGEQKGVRRLLSPECCVCVSISAAYIRFTAAHVNTNVLRKQPKCISYTTVQAYSTRIVRRSLIDIEWTKCRWTFFLHPYSTPYGDSTGPL